MREILFRGKRVDNGEWVEGYFANAKWYLDDKDMAVIFPVDLCLFPCCEFSTYEEVIPETVGQYTGLMDKNGKRIFEGDILSERPPMNQMAYIGYVVYDEEVAVWRFAIKNDTKYNEVLLGGYSNSYKVIGNIHDNPELVGGDA